MSTAEYVKAVASPSMTLISFEKCGTSYQSATPVYQQGSIEQCGLISFLALVQQLEVDLLPITWQPFLDRVGEGGTAEIRQSLINLQMSLAFKRIKDSELAMLDESIIFHRLMAEISVLGHASVRGHPNIVSLLGVCWQVIGNNVAWKAWPVLVFEKTPFGNLKEFAQSEMGQKLHPHDKVQLCGDIAMAIRDMNASSIIHGDIKPENILVVKDDDGVYHAKVTDFGYSTVSRGSSRINMPFSRGWTAPEYPRRGGYTFSEAMRMDVFSFGLVCLWLLFFSEKEEVPDDVQNALQIVLEDLVKTNKEITSDIVEILRSSLQRDPEVRCKDFVDICQLIGLPSDHDMLPQEEITEQFNSWPCFSIIDSLVQLYGLDYRVRTAIFSSLTLNANDRKATPAQRQGTECQLAVCLTLGFGAATNPFEAQIHLEASTQPLGIIDAVIGKAKHNSTHGYHAPITSLAQGNSLTAIDFKHYYREEGILEDAEANYRREITTLSDILGLNHIVVMSLRSGLSAILRDQAKWEEAEILDTDVLDRCRNVAGNDSSMTLVSLSNLASTYWNQGRFRDAELLFLEMCMTSKRQWGSGHKRTLVAKSNLASTYRQQGRWAESAKIEEQLYKLSLKKFGWKHPDTLVVISNLASTYRNQGEYEQAEYLGRKLLELRKKILGPKHPDTLLAMSHLALTHSNQGHWEKSIKLEEEVIQLNNEVLGKDHPITLTSKGNLGLYYMNAKRWADAELITKETIEGKSKIMDVDHQNLLMSMANLASIYCQQERLEEGEKMHRHILALREKKLPPEHPHIFMSLHNIADVVLRQGRAEEAYEILVDLCQSEQRVLGPSHPQTRASLEHLREAQFMMRFSL